MPSKNHRAIALWLFTCCVMVALMVIIGGLTRLTESGLSIVEWKPVTGIFPPTNEQAWQEEFTRYQTSPEFHKKNFDFTLEDFKGIFWLEFIHRLAGRLTGLVFFIPFVFFWIKGAFRREDILRLSGIFLLGGLQGVIGWYMVTSGLKEHPEVSSYRLAVHLGLAFIIFAFLFREALGFSVIRKLEESRNLVRFSCTISILIFLQVLAGALVAGLDAGLTYNTFPLMDGKLVPDGLFSMTPWWINFFENITMVQFTHRTLGILVLLSIILFCIKARRARNNVLYMNSIQLLVVTLIQVGLGISTLIYVVPIPLAVTHQAMALALFAFSLFINYRLRAIRGK